MGRRGHVEGVAGGAGEHVGREGVQHGVPGGVGLQGDAPGAPHPPDERQPRFGGDQRAGLRVVEVQPGDRRLPVGGQVNVRHAHLEDQEAEHAVAVGGHRLQHGLRDGLFGGRRRRLSADGPPGYPLPEQPHAKPQHQDEQPALHGGTIA